MQEYIKFKKTGIAEARWNEFREITSAKRNFLYSIKEKGEHRDGVDLSSTAGETLVECHLFSERIIMTRFKIKIPLFNTVQC
jgi:hypothetical protein